MWSVPLDMVDLFHPIWPNDNTKCHRPSPHWLVYCPVACLAPSHCLSHGRSIAKWHHNWCNRIQNTKTNSLTGMHLQMSYTKCLQFRSWPNVFKEFGKECELHWLLHWRHNDHEGVSNHQPHGCLLNRIFRRRSKKTSKLRVTGLCVGNSPGPVNSPYKGPVTRKMFPFDDVIMCYTSVANGSFPPFLFSYWRHKKKLSSESRIFGIKTSRLKDLFSKAVF